MQFNLCQITVLSILVAVINRANAANILYIATITSKSHTIWHRPLIHAMAAKGHNVTVIAVDVEQSPPPNVTYIEIEGAYEAFAQDAEEFMAMEMNEPFTMISEMKQFTLAFCKYLIGSKGFAQFKAYPDDFPVDVILNDYLFGSCLSGYAQHKFGRPPYIGLTAYLAQVTTLTMTGSFSFPSLIPHHMYDAKQPMSFPQRFWNFIYYIYEEISKYSQILPAQNLILKQISPNIPNIGELERDTRLVLLNSNPIIQLSEPMMPNVIPVGGMQIIPAKSLPDDLQRLVAESKLPIILFSLGTNARSDKLGSATIEAILNAMRELSEFQFLWKFESELREFAIPKNVYIRQWMPQNDLLAHPNVRLFITHSGLLSTQEAVWHGVPIVGFPMFADQYANIEYCVQQGVGIRLSIRAFESQQLVDAVREMMGNSRYTENMTKLSKAFRDQSEHPLDRAVWWVEWVLRNPDARMMQSSAIDLHWFAKYSIDVIMVIVLAFVSLVGLECWIVPKLAMWRRSRAVEKKKKQE
ncbi:UDP-glucosyltransferase 2-like [Topomyia yanbarensis]|uniref:UDP-glucosyltransferase 2-like n=1 Tax=Topomyia yanbarensis TaxID=2498891 RepID=UPI00273BEBC4|nr:UDP-glucosyltransferase 2-like [Topomyia yanbarensis]